MGKIVAILMIVFALANGEAIEWAKDFNSGLQRAKKEKKPILFVFSRHSCKYCVVLEKTTFQDKKVIKTLNNNFVSIIAYSDDGDRFPDYLWRPGTPTIWFLYSNGEPMYQPLMGAVKPDHFLEALSIVQERFNKEKKGKK